MGMGKGKRKVPIELIENKQYRMVSFSKRRKGLFKKAEEYNSITASSIAVIVLSQAGRPYVYAAPSFDSVIHRFQLNTNALDHHATPCPPALPHHTFEDAPPPPQIHIAQGSTSTTASQKEDLIDARSCIPTPVPHNHELAVLVADPWLAASPDHSFYAPPQLVDQGQGSKQHDDVYVTDAGSGCTTTTTTVPVPENNHVAALEPWRAWVDDQLRACQSVEDMVLLKHCFSHLKDQVDSTIVANYFN